jgi:uncharacterized protein (TIGR02646 family)
MIKVDRMAEPQILADNKAKWLSNYRQALDDHEISKSKENAEKKRTAENKYNQKEVKESLKKMFSGKCAYCESHISHVDYGHIEHFRPKSIFPDLCFAWDNLLLGCAICNGPNFKGSQFPEADTVGPLVNPVEENPADFFQFEFDATTGMANVLASQPRGQVSIDTFGLNRPDLIKHRNQVVKKMVFIAIRAALGDKEGRQLVLECCQREHEYAAFAHSLVQRFNLA